MELIETVLLLRNAVAFEFPVGAEPSAWDLCIIVELVRKGWNNAVKADFVGSEDDRWIRFEFTSTNTVLQEGDFFALREEQISVYDQRCDRDRKYKIANIKTNAPSLDAERREA